MDRNLANHSEIRRLIQLSAAARSCLTGESTRIRQRLDVPARIRATLQNPSSRWLAGLLAAGMVAALVWRRSAPPSPGTTLKRRGLATTLFALTLTAARPLAKVWLGDQVRRWVAGQDFSTLARRLPSRSAPSSPPF